MTCVVIRDSVITFKALAVIKRTLMCFKKTQPRKPVQRGFGTAASSCCFCTVKTKEYKSTHLHENPSRVIT